MLLDTCSSEASVALAIAGRVIEERAFAGRRASEELVQVIGELLAQHGWRLRDLDALVVTRGPGSFTGVRVGLSAAKGLAEASMLPLIALSRLEVLAACVPHDVVAVLEAGRGEVFWAQVSAGRTVEQAVSPRAWAVGHAQALGLPIICEEGSGTLLPEGAAHEVPALRATDAVPLALQRMAEGALDDPLLLDALYLHKTEQETLDRQQRHREARAAEARN